MGGLAERGRRWLEWNSGSSDRRFFLAVFLPVAAVYVATTTWGINGNVDVITNTYTAWSLGTSGSPLVQGYEPPADLQTWIAFLTPHPEGGAISSYPPGAPLIAAPLYAVAARDLNTGTFSRWDPDGTVVTIPLGFPDIWPGSIVSALTSAAAIGFLGLTFRRIDDPNSALIGAYVAAFGTSVWSVAADALWQHGPSLMWLSLAIYLTHNERWWGAGLAFAAALATRQLTGVIAAASGLGVAVFERRWRPVWRVGLTASTGLLAVSAWFWRWWDTPAPWGLRSDQASMMVGADAGVLTGDFASGVAWWQNALLGAFEPGHGFLVLSPFFLVAIPGLRRAWAIAPAAAKASALGGIAYYLIQHRIQIYAHDGYFGYRYPLEALMASAPLWFLAFRSSLNRYPRTGAFAVKVAIGAHAVFAVLG